jgi:hypothetical protein
MKFRGFLTLAFAVTATASFGQNLLFNGDFELSVPSNGTGNGWTSFNVDGAGGWRSSGGNPNGMFILNDNGNGSTNPTIQQTVSGLTIGNIYRISGDYAAGNIGGNGLADLGVEVDGNLWTFTVPGSTTPFLSFSQTFQATSSTVTVRLTGERLGDNDPRIDNIVLAFEAVPEPATMAVMGLGLLAVLRRRRKS